MMNRARVHICAVNLFAIICHSLLCFAQEQQTEIPTPPAAKFKKALVGTAHPTIIEGVDPGGRWVAVCQARLDSDKDGEIDVMVGRHGNTYGDDLHPYLIWGTGEGQQIEAFLGNAPNGDHLAILRDGQLLLIDADTRQEENLSSLGVDVDAIAELGIPAAINFGSAGQRVLWIQIQESGRPVVVVRDLKTHTENRFNPGEGLFISAFLDPSEEWILMSIVDEDKNENGKLDRPSQYSSLAPSGCRGPVASYSTSRTKGDLPNLYVRPISGKKDKRPLSKLASLGTQRLLRGEDGSISVETLDGSSFEVIPSRHAARMAGGSFILGRALFVASAGDEVGKAWIVDNQGARPVNERLVVPRGDYPIGSERLIASHFMLEDSESRGYMGVVDLLNRKATLIGGLFTNWWEGQVLTLRDNRWIQVDLDSGTERILVEKVPKFPYSFQRDRVIIKCKSNGPLSAAGGWLIDLQLQRVARYEGDPIAVDLNGRILVNDKANDGESDLMIGPLRWAQVFDN